MIVVMFFLFCSCELHICVTNFIFKLIKKNSKQHFLQGLSCASVSLRLNTIQIVSKIYFLLKNVKIRTTDRLINFRKNKIRCKSLK